MSLKVLEKLISLLEALEKPMNFWFILRRARTHAYDGTLKIKKANPLCFKRLKKPMKSFRSVVAQKDPEILKFWLIPLSA